MNVIFPTKMRKIELVSILGISDSISLQNFVSEIIQIILCQNNKHTINDRIKADGGQYQSNRRPDYTSMPRGPRKTQVERKLQQETDEPPVMPPDYNPLDEEEEEYIPPPTAQKRGRKRPPAPAPKRIKAILPPPKKITVLASVPPLAPVEDPPPENHLCVLGCSEDLEDEDDMRFHYANHYYEDVFSQHPLLGRLDLEDSARLMEVLKGLNTKKYQCDRDQCTTRKMQFLELTTHHLTVHHQLEPLLSTDPRPGLAPVLAKLYHQPRQEEALLGQGRVKQESSLELEEAAGEEDHYDPDDPQAPEEYRLEEDRHEKKKWDRQKKEPWDRKEEGDRQEKKNRQEKEKKRLDDLRRLESRADIADRVHNCVLCCDRDGMNLNLGSGLADLKYHYSVCYYNTGVFYRLVDPGQSNTVEGGVREEVGLPSLFIPLLLLLPLLLQVTRWRYTCPFPSGTCSKTDGRGRPMGYKVILTISEYTA